MGKESGCGKNGDEDSEDEFSEIFTHTDIIILS